MGFAQSVRDKDEAGPRHARFAVGAAFAAGMPRAVSPGMQASASLSTFDVFLIVIVWSAITVGMIMALAVVLM